MINAIDISPHDPATAYIATTRYKFNDYTPALYKTTDYGKTWTKIVNGVQPGHFARAVREEDAQRKSALSNALLFRRDGHRCMYCGFEFEHRGLTRDHIVPRVQGGSDTWTNVVTACARCNHHKGGRTPEQAGMALLAIPFEPNVFEFMYLANHRIRGDQMEYLQARFTGRRCWEAA